MKDLFKICNPEYPSDISSLLIDPCIVSDTDIPSGNGGINRENYTYGQLRHHPIILELIHGITNIRLRKYVKECNARNSADGFRMFKVEGEYCFWGLRIEPIVKAPTVMEMRQILLNDSKTAKAVKEHKVTAGMIRAVTYNLLRDNISRCCEMSKKEAVLAIGNQLDCAPHEDGSGYMFMVPNWAHKWFRHDGYVSKMLREV